MTTVKSHTNGFNGLRRGLLSLALTGSLTLAGWSATTLAQTKDLTIALSTPVTTVDPHFHNLTPNNAMAAHVFETLVKADANLSRARRVMESLIGYRMGI
jgi:peptide/nickel transport system substrate-binding protein